MYTFPLLAAIATLAVAQDVAFIYPPSSGASISLYRNDRININWTSTFDRNTLTVFQGPDDRGNYAFQNLQNNMPRDITNFEWTAGPVNGQSLEYPFHFQIANSECTTCDGQYQNSINLRVLSDTAPTSTTSSATATSTATSSSTTTSTSTSTSTSSPTPTPTHPPATNGSTARNIGIGVGVAGGIVAILAILGLATFCRHRKRKSREQPGESAFPPLTKAGYEAPPGYEPVREEAFGSPSQQPLYQDYQPELPAQELIAELPRSRTLGERWELDRGLSRRPEEESK